MFEKTLHAGNIAACFGAVAMAADLTFAGGAATTISAALSGVALFKSGDKATRTITQQIAKAMEAAFKEVPLTEDNRRLVAQMLPLYPLTEADLAQGNMDAPTIAAQMRKRIEASAHDPAHTTQPVLAAYVSILTATLAPVLVASGGMNTVHAAILKELLIRSDRSGDSDRLREEGITEKVIIRQAQRIAANTDNVGQAWLELQNAMDIAVRVQSEGRVQSNHGDFVDTVLQRVAELARYGDYAAAGRAIDTALQETQAQQLRLLTQGADIALLDDDTGRAADLLIRKADLDAGGLADFAALGALWRQHYEIGRDKGSNLDSLLAIDLAQLVCARAANQDERGTAQNDLGMALTILGERESGTDRLEQAVAAYTEALKERTRDRVPFAWATTQQNLGNVFQAFGQHHLDRQLEITWLQKAVTAYRASLEERTQDRLPQEWAMTQQNLANALQNLAFREKSADQYPEIIKIYDALIKVRTREANPMKWALTQCNRGIALARWGAHEAGTSLLQEASAAFNAALEVLSKDSAPLRWAELQSYCANLEVAFFDKLKDPARLVTARNHALAAREMFLTLNVAHQIKNIDEIILPKIAAREAL